MDRKLLFLVNPISGTRTKEKLIAFITEKVTSAGFLFTIDYTNATGNYTLLKEKVIADRFTDIIIVGGGDVLNSYFINKIYDKFNNKKNLIIALSVGIPYINMLVENAEILKLQIHI